jgi:hypothetical protein
MPEDDPWEPVQLLGLGAAMGFGQWVEAEPEVILYLPDGTEHVVEKEPIGFRLR